MNCFNQSLSGRCRRGVVPLGWPSLEPPYRWPALQAGCQPRVSWSMLVKRTLIWVWQGNQQPNSTVKLNSAAEHHSASFMLRLQKGKVLQHQFVTESCGSERRLATKHRERNRKRGSVCISVVKSLRCLPLHPQWLPTTGRRVYFGGVSGMNEEKRKIGDERERREWGGFVPRSVRHEE